MSNIDDVFIETTFPNIAGNPADDDAQYVDELYRGNADGVPTDDLPHGIPLTNPAPVPRGKNRLVCRTYTIARASEPFMILPADSKREQLTVIVRDDNGFIADTKDTLSSVGGRGAAFLCISEMEFSFYDYTGPLWFKAESDGAGTVTISVASVTE